MFSNPPNTHTPLSPTHISPTLHHNLHSLTSHSVIQILTCYVTLSSHNLHCPAPATLQIILPTHTLHSTIPPAIYSPSFFCAASASCILSPILSHSSLILFPNLQLTASFWPTASSLLSGSLTTRSLYFLYLCSLSDFWPTASLLPLLSCAALPPLTHCSPSAFLPITSHLTHHSPSLSFPFHSVTFSFF